MIKLTNRYATALFEYAKEVGIEKLYFQAEELLDAQPFRPESAQKELLDFLNLVQGKKEDIREILLAFLKLARKEMNLLKAEIISAAPLTKEQLSNTAEKISRILNKKLEITTTVDPGIIGGIRVVTENRVLDDTVKRRLSEMKKSIYKGVYTGK